MGVAKKKKAVAVREDVVAEDVRKRHLAELLHEHAVIADRMDALEEMKKERRGKILLLMRELGLTAFDGAAGSARFTSPRGFTVRDHERLAQLFKPLQLAALAKITADVYDAAKAEKLPIDEAVTVGHAEVLVVERAKTKAEKDRRRGYIEESKRQAEQRIAAIRESLNSKSDIKSA